MMLQTGESIAMVSKKLGRSNAGITTDIYDHALLGWQ